MRAVKTKILLCVHDSEVYSRINSTKFLASCAGKFTEPKHMSKAGVDSNSRARRLACFCNQGGRCASICLLTLQLHYCDWGRTVRFVRLALKVLNAK